ncbi:MAG: class I SAM-dependent methyltransferase [Planctomycetes bacterium]|nr:class I SAM-dependent methyltransferase [Planctomycetota bacterium]
MSDERQTEWDAVKESMQAAKPVSFGQHVAYWFRKTPRRALYATSYAKFAAKMIGRGKRVLDIGCGEGLGTWLLAKECGYAHGVDFDAEAIAVGQANWGHEPSCDFTVGDAFELGEGSYDAVVNFDVIEHVYPEHAGAFLDGMVGLLAEHGVVVVGTPNETAKQYASAVTNAGHVNLYTAERLEAELRARFKYVFLFGANDEIVHTGFAPMCHYLLVVACGKR